MNEETGKLDKKKVGIMAAIVLAVSGLLAWSLISLYTTQPYQEEEILEEAELGEEEMATEIAPAEEAPAVATPALEQTVPKEEKKAK